MASSSMSYVAPFDPPRVSLEAPEHFNPLQQRAAATAQALVAPGRSVSQREIQAMLEKNEAALRGWNVLHKQQPAKTSPTEHKEWVRRCVTFRQQIGARLEVLASLADKQIAQEDEKNEGQRTSTTFAAARQIETSQKMTLAASFSSADPHVQQQLTLTAPPQMYVPPQVSTMAMSMGPMPTSASMAIPNMAAQTPPTLFPEPLMPTVGFTSTSSTMLFPTGQINLMPTSTGFLTTTSMAATGATTSTHGYSMGSGVQTFTPNAYMTASRPHSSSAGFMNQHDYMIGSGMMNPQQQHFMPMSMPMNLVSPGVGNMYGNSNYGMPSAPMSANIHSSGNGNTNSNSINFPVDPYVTPLGYPSDVSYGSCGFPMADMVGMPMQQQQHQVMGSTTGVDFGAPMTPSNFGYGPNIGMATSSQSMMPQSMPTYQFQPTPQHFQQHNQLHHHLSQQIGADPMSLSPDSVLYGDNNVNIFEGLTDDAFFPLQ